MQTDEQSCRTCDLKPAFTMVTRRVLKQAYIASSLGTSMLQALQSMDTMLKLCMSQLRRKMLTTAQFRSGHLNPVGLEHDARACLS